MKSRIRIASLPLLMFVAIACNHGKSPNSPTRDAKRPNKDDPKHSNAQRPADQAFLDQGWNQEERQQFYYTNQGSQLIPYYWFLNLEQAKSEELLRSDANMTRLRFIPQAASDRNPDGLPIGFVKDEDPDTVLAAYKKSFMGKDFKEEHYPRETAWMGFTCAACHTGSIEKDGTTIRVDGAPAMIDLETFLEELAESLRSTHENPAKLTRFAKCVLGDSYNATEEAALRERVKAWADVLRVWVDRNAVPREKRYGFARLDAFGAILNEVCHTALEIDENREVPDAPVSYPFLWDTPMLDWVQWNGSVDNPIARNVGEVMGVFGQLTLTKDPPENQFNSTANILNLFRLEEQLKQLRAPAWPEKQLGTIDRDMAAQGEALYVANCAKCHSIRDESGNFPMTPPNALGWRFIKTVMVPTMEIGTDPKMILNFATRTAKPGDLVEFLPESMRDAEEVRRGDLLTISVQGVVRKKLGTLGPSFNQEMLANLTGHRIPGTRPPNPLAYKARPLDGIWATAPYLHNGSVPSLYQLMLPPADRVKKFFVGSREFDAKNVGFNTDPFDGGFEFDTTIEGNWNAGHSGKNCTESDAGQPFTEQERRQIVEYMKTLK
jgi:hypothetical protein